MMTEMAEAKCSAGPSAIGSACTGRTAAPTACTTPRRWASRRSAPSTTSASSASMCSSAALRRSRLKSFCSTVGVRNSTCPASVARPARPELNPSLRVEEALDKQLAGFRDGTGKDVEFLLDLNFNFKTEGYIRLVRALERHRLMSVEIDSFDPRALALIRRSIGTPLASCESLFGRRQFKDFLENYAMDVGIIDLPWNGILESMKIAAMAEAYEVNCAPHNFYGHLSTLMSAHFCAAIPNFRIMEIDIDDVPWKDDLVTEPPRIENGHLIMPTKPGWGADINEDMVKRHPPK